MELRVLRYFLAVAREETATRAADVLHITQPTLSRQLAQGEDEWGVKLFAHQGRRMVLTADGLLLRRRAEEILELVDKTEQELSQPEETVQGTVVVGTGEIGALHMLTNCITEFSALYPLVQFSFFSAPADVVKDRMDRGLIDVGLLMEPISVEKYDYVRTNFVEQMAVFMRPDDPLAQREAIEPRDLAGKKLIIPSRSEDRIRNWMGSHLQEENVCFRINLPTPGSILAAEGHGYMLVPQHGIPLCDPQRLTARPLKPKMELRSLLAWKRGQPFGQAAEKFIDYAKCFWSIDQPDY